MRKNLEEKKKHFVKNVYKQKNKLFKIRRRRDLIIGLHNIQRSKLSVDIISNWCICQEYINNIHTTLTLEQVIGFINKKIKNKTDSEILIFGIEEHQQQKHKMRNEK